MSIGAVVLRHDGRNKALVLFVRWRAEQPDVRPPWPCQIR
jgi:hypothetical protein